MRRFFEVIIYLLYRYYNKGGTKDIPYFSGLCVFTMLVILNVMTVILILEGNFNWGQELLDKYGRGGRYLLFSFALIPILLGLNYLLPKKNIVAIKLDDRKIKIYNYLLGSFIFISLASLVVVAIYSKM